MRLITFGRPRIVRDGGEEVPFQPLLVALLAYLAVRGPCDRDHLADLFWYDTKNGLNGLSTALNRIRARAPDRVWVQGKNLVGTDIPSDLADLRDALDGSAFESVSQLYSAPFLGNLKLRRQSIEFDEWVLETRSATASMVELALLQRGRDLQDLGDHSAAADAAEQAWEIAIRDGFPSPDYFDAYHRILASAGSPTANAVRSMAEDFGITLEPIEPIALQPLKTAGEPANASEPVPLSPASEEPSFPVDRPANLFGCQDELAAIASSIATSQLTTIVGLGGSGKTRLAAEFFNSDEAKRDFSRRHWVNLRDAAGRDFVAPAIAASFGQKFEDIATLAGTLPDDEPVLLVLDNFEHLLEAAEVVDELVTESGAIRVLVTSRVPLEVVAESIVQLSGLDISDDESTSAAEQLFVSSARRAGVGDDRLTGMSRTAIRDVCRSVGGNPLALEIAGGWVRLLSPAQILDALSVSSELLDTPVVGDLRSMEAVLNQAWSTLDETEQKTLMLLATFPGGCPTKEALKLPQLPIKSIGRLVQHSLVRLHVEGRITLHPLIAGYALTELEQRPELHSEFHHVLSNWCQSFAAAIPSKSGTTLTQALDDEIANFTSAWSWDAKHRLWELHRATLGTLRQFFVDSGRVSEGRALLSMVVDELRSDPSGPPNLLAQSLEALGWCEVRSGELALARTRFDEALKLGFDSDRYGRAQTLRSLGVVLLHTGEIDEAKANFREGLALTADESGTLAASLQYDLAQAHSFHGEHDQVRSAARLALDAGRLANDSLVMCRSYLLLADIEVESDPQRAIVLLNEGWVIANEASLDQLTIYFTHILGLAHLSLRDADLAEKCFADGMKAANGFGSLGMLCANHIGRAEARLLREERVDAITDLKAAIRLALKTGSARYLLWAAVVSCRAVGTGHKGSDQVRDLLSLTLSHPAADQDARAKAVNTWQAFFEDPAPQPGSEENAIGLDDVAERSLELFALAAG